MIGVCDQEINRSDWTTAVSEFEDLTLLQTWEYGEAVSQHRSIHIVRILFRKDNEVIGAAQAFVRRIPYFRGGAAFINRGPLWKRGKPDPAKLGVLLHELRKYWVEQRGMYLRIAPAVTDADEYTPIIATHGFLSVADSHPWISARLDLSKSVDTLRAALRSNWNSSLKKAERAAITVDAGTRPALLQEINSEYEKLLVRNKYQTPVTPAFLNTFQALASSVHQLFCLVARNNGKSLGGMLLARYGNTCEYLVGAISEEGRRLSAGQLLLWRAVLHAKEMGYRWFDVGGTDPDATTKGILQFKQGLGGENYRLRGEIEACPSGLMAKAIRWKVGRAIRSTNAGER